MTRQLFANRRKQYHSLASRAFYVSLGEEVYGATRITTTADVCVVGCESEKVRDEKLFRAGKACKQFFITAEMAPGS